MCTCSSLVRTICAIALTIYAVAVGRTPSADAAGAWTSVHQLGTHASDEATGIAVDHASGSVVVAGYTSGTLPGSVEPSAGGSDAFVARYDAAGNELWVHQLGSPLDDVASGVAVDDAGRIYVSGWTLGTLPGSVEPNAGDCETPEPFDCADAFLAAYDLNGNLLWVHQLGSPVDDEAYAVAVDDAGGVYIAGYTDGTLPRAPETNAGFTDAFIARYDASGTVSWVHELGSAVNDAANSVAVDASGHVYLAGESDGTLPGSPDANAGSQEAFIARYDAGGTLSWVHQLGADAPFATRGTGVTLDSAGDVYISGDTNGTLAGSLDPNAGDFDVFLAKYDAHGARVWVHELGTPTDDGNLLGQGPTVAANTFGDVFVTGSTSGTLPGSLDPHVPGTDPSNVFTAEYDAGGARIEVHELGSGFGDGGSAIALDTSGSLYIAGVTGGTLPGSTEQAAGNWDGFTARLTQTLPDAPAIGVATPADGSAVVSFVAGSDGVSAVLHYDATCTSSNGGSTGTARGLSSPIVVTHLSNGFVYTCSVTATNAGGTSLPSAASNTVTPIAPCTPSCVSVGDASKLEGDAGTRAMVFAVTLSHASAASVSVHYAVTGVTAVGGTKPVSGVDFIVKSGTVTFAVNARTGTTAIAKTIPVTIVGDTSVEADKTFHVTLSSPTGGYVIGRSVGTGTIVNDDDGTSRITVGVADAGIVLASSGSQTLNIPITLSAKAANNVSIDYTVAAGSATRSTKASGAGDYGGKTSGTVTLASGTITKTIAIPIWPDSNADPYETFTITLSNLTGTGVTMVRQSGTETILGGYN